ncbi:hypothetical protein D9758_012169 [Tetrapyrgos nigripes]|uniref:Uncharacterized protein n=1 Tax=Tetrapyrgos nigripes TaxID=182062 RepID=A0A8H5CFT0_9AGAR|nr:hypothetical protein D9758_012169 [Tetrapyrgos nigripes]
MPKLLDFNARNLRFLRGIKRKGSFQRAVQCLVWFHDHQEDAALLDSFALSMDYMSEFIKALILDVQKHIIPLTNMANSLKTVQELVRRDNAELLHSRSQAENNILSSLWTRLRGDQRRSTSFDDSIVLLSNIDVYRERALSRVEGALYMLKNMQSKMEQLRLRLRAPELLREKFTVEEHLQSLEVGIENLVEARKDIQAREAEVFRQFQLEGSWM